MGEWSVATVDRPVEPVGDNQPDTSRVDLLSLLHRTGALAEAEELMRRMDAGADLGPAHTFEEVDARLKAICDSK